MTRQAARVIASHLPPSVLRAAGRWMLRGPRRRALRDGITSALGADEVVVPRGPLKGARLVVTGSNPGYALGVSEPEVQDALAEHLRPGAVVFDVGANIGYLTLVASQLVATTGHVYAFEPLVENVAMLRDNLTRNGAGNVTVLEVALGASAGSAPLGIPDASDGGLTASLIEAPSDRGARTLQVNVEAADDLVASGRCRPPDLVKIDVEGAEADVLQGMRRILEDHQPVVICEVHALDRADALWSAVHRAFEPSGHVLSELAPDAGGMPHVVAVPAAERERRARAPRRNREEPPPATPPAELPRRPSRS